MKRLGVLVFALAVAVSFTSPSFAWQTTEQGQTKAQKKEEKTKKKEEKAQKKEEKKQQKEAPKQ